MKKGQKRIKVFGVPFLALGKSTTLSSSTKVKGRYRYDPSEWSWTPKKIQKVKDFDKTVKKDAKHGEYAVRTNYEPGKKRQKIVLCFSLGGEAENILYNLKKKGIKYFYLSYTDFMLLGRVSIIFDGEYEKKILSIIDVKLDLDDVACVLWTGPDASLPSWDMFSSDFYRKGQSKDFFIYQRRWSQLLKDLKGLLPKGTKWLPSDPFNGSQEWQNKHGEYSIARRVGMNTPPTICTNSYEDLKAFAKKHGNELLFREFSCPPYNLPIKKINLSRIKDLSRLKASPCTFQKYVDKEYELRIVYLGGNVYPCKIHSQDSKIEAARFDWRVYDNPNVKWELSSIPVSLKRKILKLMKILDLEWGSLDFIRSTDGKYYFLEVNRPGAYYWLESFVGLELGKIISEYLIEKVNIDTYRA